MLSRRAAEDDVNCCTNALGRQGTKHMTEFDAIEGVSYGPGPNADTTEEIESCIAAEVRQIYDVYSYRHAATILRNSYTSQLMDIEGALLQFRITTKDIASPGGNESIVPKHFSGMLRPREWYETRIQGDLIVRVREQTEEVLPNGGFARRTLPQRDPITLVNHVDGHKIDYVKGRVALDTEWNSKDQTYDRDLFAFRTFHECGVISVGVLITRSEKLNAIFDVLPLRKKDGSVDRNDDGTPKLCKQKYGASTTWMGKLLYRLNAGRHGGCPVLVFGIRPDVVTDWPLHQEPVE
jgi:CRISPR-associated protein Csd2